MKKIYLFLIISFISAQVDYLNWYNHPELKWETIETEHFIINFHNGTERSAREAATVAEEVYQDITTLYNYKPDSKTVIVITDYEDYSNGAAYYNFNKMIISAKPANFYLRGSHRWLQNVITHEFTHIVQIAASMKYTRFIPYSALQVLSYADEKRKDVMLGFPNTIVNYPIATEIVPPWFAEGTAQVMYAQAYFDYWDSTRDMVLRDRVYHNNLLTFDQMHTFGKMGIGHESVYNQGFSFVKYITDKYGQQILSKICDEMAKPLQYSMNKSIKKSMGISGYALYDNWKEEMTDIYNMQLNQLNNPENYKIIESKGFSNMHPIWSPSGKKIAFISDKEHDYFGRSDLFIYDTETDESEKIQPGVRTQPTWINDSLIVYSKRSDPNKQGSKFFNLYSYDLVKEEEEQLTEDLRLVSPVHHKETNQIFALNTYDGTSNIVAGTLDSKDWNQITDFNDGIQIFNLTVSDSLILFDAVRNHERDLFFVNIYTQEIGDYKITDWDIRNPNILGDKIIYSEDKTGIFNLYYQDKNKKGYITNVIGGAFMPSFSVDGNIVFSIYDQGKYSLALIENMEIIDDEVGYSKNVKRSDFEIVSTSIQKENKSYYRPSSDIIDEGISLESKPYVEKMMGLFIIPRITIDDNTFKPGIFFFDNEYLDRMTMIGGLSFNSNKDIDLSLFFDYNVNKSSYYFNFYWVTRNFSRVHPYINKKHQVVESLNYHVDLKYELFSADIGNRFIFKDHKFWMFYTYSKYRQYNYPTLLHCYESDGYVCEKLNYKYAHDYFRSHSITLKYKYDSRTKDYLYRYTMWPKNGYLINASIAYEKNNLFEGFKANDQYGGFTEDMKSHDVVRYKVDLSNYWTMKSWSESILFKNNIQLSLLSRESVDDFLYFYGGGLFGMKGYTYFEPTLQGTDFFMITNSITTPIFKEQNFKFGWIYFNSLSFSLMHQFGRAFNGKIKVYSGKFIGSQLDEDLINSLQLSYNWDGLDVDDEIPDNLEDYIYPDIYHNYDVVSQLDPECITTNEDGDILDQEKCTEYSISDLKDRYEAMKHSVGLEVKLLGFSFYSYPTALTYEYHIPVKDPWNNKGQQYLKILFDFN